VFEIEALCRCGRRAHVRALRDLLTRYAARKDSADQRFSGPEPSVRSVMTAVGVWFWEPMSRARLGWMAALCVTGRWGTGC
jgi:hypothetical protein